MKKPFKFETLDSKVKKQQSKVDEVIQQWAVALTEAQILAMNCISPLAEKGCGHFELCDGCLKRGYCIDYYAKKFLDKYFEKELKK